jgi:hypothetical protein
MILSPDALRSLLQKQKIATLAELKEGVRTSAAMTVFRKLKALGYQTSYSHRGKYYTLTGTPEYDDFGLWSYRAVYFSRDGNLLATAQRFVEEAQIGITADELRELLHVEVKQSLLHLYRDKRIGREQISGRYVYLSKDSGVQLNQKLARQEMRTVWELGESPLEAELPAELKAAIILFFSLLDEQQRRLYAGLEAQKLGYGGDRKIAEFFGVDVHTVARGRGELFGGQVQRERVRKEGGGREATKKNPASDRSYCALAQERNCRRSNARVEVDS